MQGVKPHHISQNLMLYLATPNLNVMNIVMLSPYIIYTNRKSCLNVHGIAYDMYSLDNMLKPYYIAYLCSLRLKLRNHGI